ncbi:MAG: alkaline phosphatase family protein [Euryarchaeota archaeon]|nr:alkaline phosphatase family protein [Euryarchaeota archaeon]
MKQVIIIGVDGATSNLMDPWMESGKLPTFARMNKNGAYGTLKSTIPPFSAPAWTTIITGCNPGKHGIYDFFRTDSFSKKLINSRERKTPALWNILTEMRKNCIIVNVPGTYPPESINGIMITGLLTPSSKSDFTYPKSLKKDLVEGKIGNFELESFTQDGIPLQLTAKHAPEKLVHQLNNTMRSQGKVTINLMKKNKWNLSMVVFRGIDEVQHYLWNRRDLLLSCYQTVDTIVDEMINIFPNATIIIVSDHGFDGVNKYLFINNVLYNAGYLKTKSDLNYSYDSFFLKFYQIFNRFLFYTLPFRKIIPKSLIWKLLLLSDTTSNIDFSQTQAFLHSISSRGIRINLKKKYSQGMVDSNDYEKLLNDLIRLFKEIIDPETNQPIIKDVYRSEDIYGPNAVNDPLDLILDLEKGYGIQDLLKISEKTNPVDKTLKNQLPFLSNPGFYDWSGDHFSDGVVFLYGNEFKHNFFINASAEDIVPTILADLDLPIPNHIDGKVIKDAFVKGLNIKKINLNSNFLKKKELTLSEKKKIESLKKYG